MTHRMGAKLSVSDIHFRRFDNPAYSSINDKTIDRMVWGTCRNENIWRVRYWPPVFQIGYNSVSNISQQWKLNFPFGLVLCKPDNVGVPIQMCELQPSDIR